MCRYLCRRRLLPLLLCVMAALGAVVRPGRAQPLSTTAADQTIPRYRTGVDLVAVNVTVLDRTQRLVAGLSVERFEIFEDNVRQEISYFESRDVPLDVVLLIDTSSSMYDKLRAIRLASDAFARALRPGDRGAVMTFNQRVTSQVPLTKEAPVLDAAIRSIKAGGGTSLYDSVYIALRGLTAGGTSLSAALESQSRGEDSAERIRRQAIVVLTDGTDTTSLMTFEVVLEEARRANVMIYTICVLAAPFTAQWREDETHWTNRLDVNMTALARDTGALAFTVTTESDLAAAYDRVTTELMHQYLLAYSPKAKRSLPSRGFRRIMVRLRDVPDATPRARTGYLWTSDAPAASHSRLGR